MVLIRTNPFPGPEVFHNFDLLRSRGPLDHRYTTQTTNYLGSSVPRSLWTRGVNRVTNKTITRSGPRSLPRTGRLYGFPFVGLLRVGSRWVRQRSPTFSTTPVTTGALTFSGSLWPRGGPLSSGGVSKTPTVRRDTLRSVTGAPPSIRRASIGTVMYRGWITVLYLLHSFEWKVVGKLFLWRVNFLHS